MADKNEYHNHKPSVGQNTADKIATLVGSWKFIIFQSVVLFVWIVLNIVAWMQHWDPYPFILLNLVLGVESAYAAPIILMSQNLAAERDRRKSEADLATDRRSEREIEEIKRQLNRIENDKIKKMLDILEKK